MERDKIAKALKKRLEEESGKMGSTDKIYKTFYDGR